MADNDMEPEDIEKKVLDLANSMDKVRSRQADRDDVVVDMHNARLSRLEILASNLKPVFDAVPVENEQFEFSLVKGEPPRLWIDLTSFVRMAGDGREFEFVKDTRLGRTILGRSSNVDVIGEHVSDYVAERILERERMLEGEWVSLKTAQAAQESETEEQSEEAQQQAVEQNVVPHSRLRTFMWFIIGLLIGSGALFSIFWFDQVDTVVNWVAQISRELN